MPDLDEGATVTIYDLPAYRALRDAQALQRDAMSRFDMEGRIGDESINILVMLDREKRAMALRDGIAHSRAARRGMVKVEKALQRIIDEEL